MDDLTSALTKTVSISSFNKGKAGLIFEDVKKSGAKVVMKNNNPECVLISPDEYLKLLDMVEDLKLAAISKERDDKMNPQNLIKEEDVLSQLGIKEEELKDVKVDIE